LPPINWQESRNMSEVRWDLIRRIQAQIEAGTYVTEAKLRLVCEKIVRSVSANERFDSFDNEDFAQATFGP
jgi:hypothetical protein